MKQRPTRLAVLGAGHWHAPLFMAGLAAADATVTAAFDPDETATRAFAARWGGTVFTAPDDLMRDTSIDVALVLGTPAGMPALAAPFIARGTPVILEKPGAARLADLHDIANLCRRTGTPVAVPFVQRVTGAGRALLDAVAGERVTAASFAFIAGGPERYRTAGSVFMLDPAEAGGGAMLNLGIHFVDLAAALIGGTVEEAVGVRSSALWSEAVEDHAMVSMRFSSGAVATVEAAYAFPDHPARRLFTATVVTDRSFVRFDGREVLIMTRDGGERRIPIDAETDRYYATFLAETLKAFRARQAPAAGIDALIAAYDVIDRALGPPG